MKFLSSFFLIFTIITLLTKLTNQVCQNTSEAKYDLSQPAQILHYYSTCSSFTRRTCCSPKNLQTLLKKIKKLTESENISSNCKNSIASAMCVLCDGDWGEGYYNGVCATHCLGLYYQCQRDLFAVEPNGKLRGCKEDDLFCWKLKDIMSHYKADLHTSKGQAQVCSHFDLIGTQQDIDCWQGQISAQIKGKGRQKIKYEGGQTKIKKKTSRPWTQRYRKQLIYVGVILILVSMALYKWWRPTRRGYYRLD